MPNSLRYVVRKGAVAALGGSLVAAGLVLGGPTPTAHAHAADPRPGQIGASWLISELTGGLIHNDQFNFDDYGATVEAAYALDAIGASPDIAPIADALEANAAAYTHPGDGEIYAGSTGKLLSFVEDHTSDDPTSYGGLDLVTQMESVTKNSGRIEDVSAFGDFANVFGQAWAVRGLTLAGSDEAPAATEFLLNRQCGAGYFHLDFSETCGASVPPVDTAAVVVILLQDLTIADAGLAAARDAAVDDAIAWIKTRQAADGSFDGGTDTEGPNANSTGLAGWALDLTGRHAAAEKAATWIRGRQVVGLDCEGELVNEQGAIAYDRAAYNAGAANGITVAAAGQWDFATIQGLPALAVAPASEAGEMDLGRIPHFLNGGGRQLVTVRGLAPGEAACASIGRNDRRVVGDKDGIARAKILVPDRTGPIQITAEGLDQGVGIAGPVVLSAKKLPLDLRSNVARRGTQRVVVRGLWAGEPVVVKDDGDVVARGRANDDGRFSVRYGVGRQGGKHDVVVIGRFKDRRNAASYHVG
jgi:hypothetical protein